MTMEKSTIRLLKDLYVRRYIGGKHLPEKTALLPVTKWLNKQEYRAFEKEYRQLISEEYLIRLKKRTGKGSDWHISLNPRLLRQITDVI